MGEVNVFGVLPAIFGAPGITASGPAPRGRAGEQRIGGEKGASRRHRTTNSRGGRTDTSQSRGTGSSHEPSYPSYANIGSLFDVMLPEPNDGISIPPKLPRHAPVPPHVTFYLIPPEPLETGAPLLVPITVPKVSVAEEGRPLTHQKVRVPVYLRVPLEPDPGRPQQGSSFDLYLGVPAAYPGHDPRPFFGSEDIHQ